jgi:hypothetical protein
VECGPGLARCNAAAGSVLRRWIGTDDEAFHRLASSRSWAVTRCRGREEARDPSPRAQRDRRGGGRRGHHLVTWPGVAMDSVFSRDGRGCSPSSCVILNLSENLVPGQPTPKPPSCSDVISTSGGISPPHCDAPWCHPPNPINQEFGPRMPMVTCYRPRHLSSRRRSDLVADRVASQVPGAPLHTPVLRGRLARDVSTALDMTRAEGQWRGNSLGAEGTTRFLLRRNDTGGAWRDGDQLPGEAGRTRCFHRQHDTREGQHLRPE